MPSESFVREMPKVELHVHLEGSIRPETVLKLSKRNDVPLPADTVEGLREWYTFRDFPHFVDVYVAVSKCIVTPDDVELITREFLEGQKAQNVLHSEVTYTASTIEKYNKIPWPDQLAALNRAREYGEKELGITMNVIVDIVRGDEPERALEVARWAAEAQGNGVCALGLAGEERLGTAQYREAFELAQAAGLPIAAHAGETQGTQSIKEVLEIAKANRIGHGVRCIEDHAVVRELRDRQIPLEVCPTSNVRLGVFPSLEEHPLPRLLDQGLYVTVNSDDPPMFGTTLTDEFQRTSKAFEFTDDILWTLSLNAARAAFLPEGQKRELMQKMREGFSEIE
jgi:adenosine deaminase